MLEFLSLMKVASQRLRVFLTLVLHHSFPSSRKLQPAISELWGFIITIIELTYSKAILEYTIEIEPQPVTLDFNNLSQYSSRSKQNCLRNFCFPTVIPICFNLLLNCLGIAPKEPTTNGVIFTFTFHIFCNSLPKS